MNNNSNGSISRRNFVRTASLATAAVTSGIGIASGHESASVNDQIKEISEMSTCFSKDNIKPMAGKPMIAFQTNVDYLLTYGIERFLDDVQERAQVNTVVLFADLYHPSWDGLDKSTNTNGAFKKSFRDKT